jgi:ABC-type transport system involved in multi-copper enzyme maturation permease subunit
MVNPNLAFHEGDAMKISFFMVAGIIFISINIMLGYLISCLSRSSSVSLSVSLIIWTIIAIIYPNISWLGVNKLKPIPTVAQVNDEIKKKQDNLSDCFSGWNSDWRNKEPNKKVLKRKDCWDRKNKIENDLWRDYYLKLFSQTETAINIASLSPFSSFQFLCDKITDNGFYGYRNFRNQVTNYQDEYKSFIKAKDKEDKESYHTFWSESYYAESFMSNKPVNSDEIPKFDYKPASISSILKSSAWNIAYLTVWLLLLYGGVFIAFIRYDVR